MSETSSYPIVYPRYHGEYAAFPYPSNPQQLEAVVEERIKPGLEHLSDMVKNQLVDYLGYGLAPICVDVTHVRQRPSSVQSWHEFNNRDDFLVGGAHLFKWMLRYGEQRCMAIDRDLVFGYLGLRQSDFVLGPAVSRRSQGEDDNQQMYIEMLTGSSAMISGRILLEAMVQHNGRYSRSYEISAKQMADFFTSAYNMKALCEDFEAI